jgi:hypothetical protein
MKYNLKNKIQVTKDFLSDLEIKSWQEIEYLQSQIANIEVTPKTTELVKLLKNLLTSYYVFAGGLENLTDVATYEASETVREEDSVEVSTEIETELPIENSTKDDNFNNEVSMKSKEISDEEISEPFEYFVDFDEPVGKPLTDDDLYN